jgi:anti-sigma factor RsiW
LQSTKGLALEVRLSAYLDGEVSEAERKELEQLVARDDEARLLLEMLKAGNAFGNKAFEEFLHDPVPLSLVRRIKQGPGVNPKAERVVSAAPRQAKVRLWPRALAASIALLLVGSSTGYLIGRTSNDGAPSVNVAAARSWLDDIADYHRIYSRQTAEHLVEVPASGDARIENWLASSVGVNFAERARPDLRRRSTARRRWKARGAADVQERGRRRLRHLFSEKQARHIRREDDRKHTRRYRYDFLAEERRILCGRWPLRRRQSAATRRYCFDSDLTAPQTSPPPPIDKGFPLVTPWDRVHYLSQ